MHSKNSAHSREDLTPHRVVKLGDSWANRLEEPSDANTLNVDVKSTFKNWDQHADRKCMRIIYAGSFAPQAAPNAPNLPVKIENGRVSGETWFDPELGMIVKMLLMQDMNLKITRQGKTLSTPAQPARTRATALTSPCKKDDRMRTWYPNCPASRAAARRAVRLLPTTRF